MSEHDELYSQNRINIRDNIFEEAVKTDVLIVGAGASGLFCARILGKRGLKVTIMESSSRPGRKLAVSGGGHANFSNFNMSSDKFLAPPDPAFCIPALEQWTPEMMLAYLEKAGFTVIEKNQGKLFLQEAAIDLVKYLLLECQESSVEIYYNERLLNLSVENGQFLARGSKSLIQAHRVILCLGSPARPKLASCLDCWKLVSEMGHRVFPPKAALTPLNYTGDGQDKLHELAGIGLKVRLRLLEESLPKGEKFWTDDLLFTHTGLSGPAVLSASLYYNAKSRLEINFLPDINFESMLDREGKKTVRGLLRSLLPARLVEALLPPELSSRKIAQISRNDRKLLGQKINSWQIGQLKTAGLDKAEVCSGGVDLKQINAANMESALYKGLHICGEMQNVTGELGGYNLHWAFASARLAAMHILSII